MRLIVLTLLISGLFINSFANEIVAKYATKISDEQGRIDQLDGITDQKVSLKTDLQSAQATETYILSVHRIVNKVVNNFRLTDATRIDQLRRVLNLLEQVNASNVHFYTNSAPVFKLIERVQDIDDVNRLESILKSNVFSSLNLIAFYLDKSVAERFFLAAAKTEPAELLKHYDEFDYKPFSTKVLDEIARVAPMKIKTYLHTWNTVHQRIKASPNPITQEVYDIYRNKGAATRSFVLLNDIFNGKLTIDEAHEIAKKDSTLFA